MELLIVTAIVAGAAWYVCRTLIKTARGTAAGCHCSGCDGCARDGGSNTIEYGKACSDSCPEESNKEAL